MRGDYKGAFGNFGRGWASAVTDWRWWIDVGMGVAGGAAGKSGSASRAITITEGASGKAVVSLSSTRGFSPTGVAKFDKLFAKAPQATKMTSALDRRGISLIDDATRLKKDECAFITRNRGGRLEIVYDSNTTTLLDVLHESRHGMQIQRAEASGILGGKSVFKTDFVPMWERGAYDYEMRLSERYGFSSTYDAEVGSALRNAGYTPGYEQRLYDPISTKNGLMQNVEPRIKIYYFKKD